MIEIICIALLSLVVLFLYSSCVLASNKNMEEFENEK